MERIVVVGAGMAGLRCSERLRELGFEGELVIIGSERIPPYHRPALSKQLLTGVMRPADLMLPSYRDVDAKWRLGTPAGYLVPRNKTVHLPGGEELRYDGLVVATGVEAKRPNDVPYHDPRVMVMRTLPDALDLERMIASTRGPVAVVGGGFTGCEIAASLRHMGRDVVIIGRQPNLLGNVLGETLGEWLTGLHSSHGVELALGRSVQGWQPGRDGIKLHLSDGTVTMAACVVVAAGTTPSTTWLRGSGLPLDNGVVCEATCHVVGAEDVVAAGDIAQWPNLRFDSVPRRIEHWLNAIEMGRAAAESLLAGRGAAKPFTPMPRFWTEQYGVRIQAAGVPKLGTDTKTLGTPDDGTGTVVGYLRDDRLVGVVGLDCPSSVLTWTETVCRQNPVPQRQNQPVGVPEEAEERMTRGRGGRHTLPPKRKWRQPEELPSQTSGRLRPAELNGQLGPMEPSVELPPVRADARFAPAPIDQTAPLDLPAPRFSPASSSRMRPVAPPSERFGPAASNGRMVPVQGSDGRGPADSNGRMRPVSPPSERFGPAASSGRMAPVQNNNGRGPADSNGRMRPVGPLSARFDPAASNGRMIPVRGSDDGRGPAESNSRMRPVERFGPAASNGRMNPVGRFDPEASNGRMAPAQGNNGRGPAESDPRMRPVERFGPAASNGRMAPVTNNNGRIPPITRNGRLPDGSRPADMNGHAGPERTNGRIPPVTRNGRGPADSNPRMRPVEPERTNGALSEHDQKYLEELGRQLGPIATNNGFHPEMNGRYGPADSNPRMRPVEVGSRARAPRLRLVRPDDGRDGMDATGRIPPVGPSRRWGT